MTSSKNNRWKIVFGGFVPGELVVGFTLSSISALMFKISSDLSKYFISLETFMDEFTTIFFRQLEKK